MIDLKNHNISWEKTLPVILIIGLSIAFFGTSFGWNNARKIYYACSVIALIAFLFSNYRTQLTRVNCLLPVSLFCYGLGVFTWVLIFSPSDPIGNYYSYKSLSKLTISAALLILYFSVCPLPFWLNNLKYRWLIFIIFFTAITGIAAISCYQHFYLLVDRVSVGSHIATMAAYMVSAAGLACVSCMPSEKSQPVRLLILCIVFVLTYLSIILTETRSTILAFPFIFLSAIFMFRQRIQIAHFKKFIFIILLAIGFSTYEFGYILKTRMDEVTIDIVNYTQHNNSNTSLGARIAMYQTGFQAGLNAMMGESIQDRAESISQQVAQENKLSGALRYTYTNLHNDFIESFSLRGIWGVSLLLFIYYAIFYTAFKQRNAVLFAIGLSFVLYGLTDAIFSDDLPLTYYIAIIFTLYFARRPST